MYPALKRYWSQRIAARLGEKPDPPSADRLREEHVLLAGLRLGVRETLDFLITRVPSSTLLGCDAPYLLLRE